MLRAKCIVRYRGQFQNIGVSTQWGCIDNQAMRRNSLLIKIGIGNVARNGVAADNCIRYG
ncbi:hypothetical protein D3C80_2153820 [compost metagenome]